MMRVEAERLAGEMDTREVARAYAMVVQLQRDANMTPLTPWLPDPPEHLMPVTTAHSVDDLSRLQNRLPPAREPELAPPMAPTPARLRRIWGGVIKCVNLLTGAYADLATRKMTSMLPGATSAAYTTGLRDTHHSVETFVAGATPRAAMMTATAINWGRTVNEMKRRDKAESVLFEPGRLASAFLPDLASNTIDAAVEDLGDVFVQRVEARRAAAAKGVNLRDPQVRAALAAHLAETNMGICEAMGVSAAWVYSFGEPPFTGAITDHSYGGPLLYRHELNARGTRTPPTRGGMGL